MGVDLRVLSELVQDRSFVGKLVKLSLETAVRDDGSHEVIRLEVWDASGRIHRDTMSAAQTSKKLRAWTDALAKAIGSDGDPAAITDTRHWEWKTGGSGQYTYNVLVPGGRVEPPECDEQDLAFLAELSAIAEGVSPEVPFQFSSQFGNEIAGQYPKLSDSYGGDSARWVRALCVKGVLIAQPGEWPGEVKITAIFA